MTYYDDEEWYGGGDTGGYNTGYEAMYGDQGQTGQEYYQAQNQNQEFDWEGYFKLLEENAGGGYTYNQPSQPTNYGGGGVTEKSKYSDYIQPSDIYGPGWNGPGYHGGGGGGGGPRGELDLSGIDLDLPEYALPEEDEGIYKKEYETVYQRTKAPVEQGVHEAIMSSKSLDNPMARMDFVRKALSGYGEALTGIAQAATEAAQEKAAYEYNKMVQEYNMQYKAQYAEAVAAYEKEIQQAISNWEAGTGEGDDMWDEWNQKLIDYYG